MNECWMIRQMGVGVGEKRVCAGTCKERKGKEILSILNPRSNVRRSGVCSPVR